MRDSSPNPAGTAESFTRDPTFRQGVILGAVVGLSHVVHSLLNSAGNLDAGTTRLIGDGQLAAMLLLFGLAGLRGGQITGRLGGAVQAGFWTWLVSSAIGIAVLWVATFAFMDSIRQNAFMIQDFQRSGSRSMDAFIIEDAIGASTFGVGLALVLALAMASLGGLIGKALKRPPSLAA
jgi:hypothetical protein